MPLLVDPKPNFEEEKNGSTKKGTAKKCSKGTVSQKKFMSILSQVWLMPLRCLCLPSYHNLYADKEINF